jgi:hypothetical protein
VYPTWVHDDDHDAAAADGDGGGKQKYKKKYLLFGDFSYFVGSAIDVVVSISIYHPYLFQCFKLDLLFIKLTNIAFVHSKILIHTHTPHFLYSWHICGYFIGHPTGIYQFVSLLLLDLPCGYFALWFT